MLRFTIRDVLWLTVVVGMGVGWYVNHWRFGIEVERWKHTNSHSQQSTDSRQTAPLNGRFNQAVMYMEEQARRSAAVETLDPLYPVYYPPHDYPRSIAPPKTARPD